MVIELMKEPRPEKRDWRISATLLAVWAVALFFIGGQRDDIPLSMIAMATIFFIILIPAMNDMVRSLERHISGKSGSGVDQTEQ